MKYKYLYFDLDRTLWDYDANSTQALSQIFHEFYLNNYFDSPAEFVHIYNINNDMLWDSYRKGVIRKAELRTKRFAMTLSEKNVTDDTLAFNIGEKYMDITPRLNILAPNTIELLKYLKAKDYRLFILTNGFISTQEKKMKNSELDIYFERVFSSEELGINKPAKEIFHWAVTSVNAPKEKCLMIGDDIEVDIQGALSYGIDAAWFNPNGDSASIKPTITISDLGELKNIL